MPSQTVTLESLLAALAAIVAQIEQLRGQQPGTFLGQIVEPGGWDRMREQFEAERAAKLELPAPFGRYPDGTPKAAPAYNAARALWEAGQREEEGGKRLFYALDPAYKDNPQAFEDAVNGLATSFFGRYWLSKDVNAVMIDPAYQLRWNGYVVKPRSANPDDGFARHPAVA